MKISNIRIKDMGERITVECPNCHKCNYYSVMGGLKFECIRPCHHCEAILIFDCEEGANES